MLTCMRLDANHTKPCMQIAILESGGGGAHSAGGSWVVGKWVVGLIVVATQQMELQKRLGELGTQIGQVTQAWYCMSSCLVCISGMV